MSSFTYEIDERNLRLKMKDFTVPVKEDAWQKFEAFADISDSPRRETGIKFNFSLNRNVVLPSIFGVVIILFSFLLVNFVSIKSPAANLKKHDAESPAVATQAPQNEPQNKPAPAVVQVESKPGPRQQVVVEDIKPEEKAIITALVSEPAPDSVQKLNAEQQPQSDSVASNTPSEDEARAKRRAERRAARAEAKKLEEIKPTPVYEEHDIEEVRPD